MPYSCAPFVHNSCSKKEFRKVGVRSTPYRLSPRPCREIFRHSSAVQSSCRLPVENLDSRETARKTGRQKRADTPPAVLDATLGQAVSLRALDGSDTIVFVTIQGYHLHNVPPFGGLPPFKVQRYLTPAGGTLSYNYSRESGNPGSFATETTEGTENHVTGRR